MDLFGPFVAMYLEAMGDLTPAQRRLILGGCRFWCWMRLEPGPPSFDTSAGAPYNQ